MKTNILRETMIYYKIWAYHTRVAVKLVDNPWLLPSISQGNEILPLYQSQNFLFSASLKVYWEILLDSITDPQIAQTYYRRSENFFLACFVPNPWQLGHVFAISSFKTVSLQTSLASQGKPNYVFLIGLYWPKSTVSPKYFLVTRK